MEFQMSTDEASMLEEILSRNLRELRVEVRRTDTPAYHDALQEREANLKALLDRLRGELAA